ncbi:fatty-acid amide hydrolase 2-like isoform 4-T4 [Rhinophrynus dorsalis]
MFVFRRLLVLILKVVSRILLVLIRIFSVFSSDPARPDPPLDPLLLTPATVLAERIRRGELKSSALVQSFISRIRQVNPSLNAVVCERFEEALQEARNVDNLVSGTEDEVMLKVKYPLLGVPFTVKEAFALQGGEGCILAAGGSVIGVGSDIGGSIRMPAFFNGIYGHKPTAGIVPNDGQFPDAHGRRSEFLCTGPMCRYATDLITVLKVMAGEATSRLSLDQDVSLTSLRFFSMENDGGSPFISPVDKELVEAQRRVVKHLEKELGVSVQPVTIYNLRYSFQIWSAMMSSDGDMGQSFADLMGDGKKIWPLWELVKWMFGLSEHTLPAIGLALTEKLAHLNPQGNERMIQKAKHLREEICTLLGEDGILIYPSHPKTAPRHHEPLAMPFNFAYTGIFNVLGLPVTQCPLSLSQAGLPMGIQLIASHYNDHLTLALAQHLEKALGGWIPAESKLLTSAG